MEGVVEKNPVTVEGFDGSLRELAQKICRMRYDQVAEFFRHCAEELGSQAWSDYQKGRKQLSSKLDRLTMSIAFDVVPQFEKIFKLCRPHMKDDL